MTGTVVEVDVAGTVVVVDGAGAPGTVGAGGGGAGMVMGVGGALALPMNALGLVSGQLRLGTISAVCNVVLGTVLCLTIGAAGAPLATAVAHGVVGVPLAAMAVRERLGRPAAVSGTAGRFPP